MNPPTAVFGGPAPSAMESVAVEPDTETAESEPPEGTLARDHGARPAL